MNEKQFVPLLVESFGDIVDRYSTGSLPIGISLTGGFDSRMIMACLNTESAEFPCFTFGSQYRETFDVQIARKVAKTCDQYHYVLELGDDFLRNFPRYIEKSFYVKNT